LPELYFVARDLCFRELVEDDIPLVARWLSDPLVIEWWHGTSRPFDEAKVHEHYFVESEGWATNAIVELHDRPVGFQEWYPLAELSPEDRAKHAALGFDVVDAFGIDQFVGASDLHGRGIGTRQVQAVTAWLHDQRAAERVGSAPVVENARSIHVLEKAGFHDVGVIPAFDDLDGEMRDCLLMAHARVPQSRCPR
jgi:aminoglycoside 6'-N-acetyltransferase